MTAPKLSAGDLSVGQTFTAVLVEDLKRTQIVQYAGSSGDYNPLHTDEIFTTQVAGYPSVFAHGMLTMGMTGAMITDLVGDGVLKRFGGRFTSQCGPATTSARRPRSPRSTPAMTRRSPSPWRPPMAPGSRCSRARPSPRSTPEPTSRQGLRSAPVRSTLRAMSTTDGPTTGSNAYDLVIIGGTASGLSVAISSLRSGLGLSGSSNHIRRSPSPSWSATTSSISATAKTSSRSTPTASC
ncbi:MAG: MaoC/PaaZ C-terminal domain-containing protein [Acidimicrobiales bacterium]